MRVVHVDPDRPDPAVIALAARELREGRLVAFPTETVYGLGARALDPEAVARVFEAKGRPRAHPLIAHVLGEDDARSLARRWPDRASTLARAFWPGPLTLVVARAARVPDAVTAGGDSVAVRAPSHAVARALIAALGEPVVAPSANRYQSLSPTRAEHVAQSLMGQEILVLDAGPCERGIESTVVDVRTGPPRVLRFGALALADVARVCPDAVSGVVSAPAGEVRPSPGMDVRHYAPRTRMTVAPTREEAITRAKAATGRAAILLFGGEPPGGVTARVLPRDPVAAGRELYAALHALDAAGVDELIVEPPPEHEGWEAIRDRLARAST